MIFEDRTQLDFEDLLFLQKANKSKTYTVVIDNTEYVRAVKDQYYVIRPQSSLITSEGINLTIEQRLKFTSNDLYYKWMHAFIIVLGILGGSLLLSLLCYWRQVCIFNRETRKRRELKQKLLELRDHEYKNFLQKESMIIRKQATINLIQRNLGINSSVANEEEVLDESD